MSNKLVKQYIQDYAALVALCEKLALSPFIAIDTEFVRTRTLYPKLGLLQVNNGEFLALIDPLAIADLSPFWALLLDHNIVKVLHACSEDLEVFLTAANCKPANLIDSQIMMSFLGNGLSMGYAAMVQHFCDVELDKSESRTDWLKRPLTTSQLSYAQGDVEYLFHIYPQLVEKLTAVGWLDAAKQETQLLIDRKFTPIDEDKLYTNLKMAWRLNPKQLNLLKHLARWRYQQAQKKDMPIGFIAKDHTLMALAQSNPKSVGVMATIEGVDVLDVRHKGKAMLEILKQANDDDSACYPTKIVRLDEYPGYKQIYKTVKDFVEEAATAAQLQPENLASKKQINQFLSWHFKLNEVEKTPGEVDVLLGWRLALFGEKLQLFAKQGFKQ